MSIEVCDALTITGRDIADASGGSAATDFTTTLSEDTLTFVSSQQSAGAAEEVPQAQKWVYCVRTGNTNPKLDYAEQFESWDTNQGWYGVGSNTAVHPSNKSVVAVGDYTVYPIANGSDVEPLSFVFVKGVEELGSITGTIKHTLNFGEDGVEKYAQYGKSIDYKGDYLAVSNGGTGTPGELQYIVSTYKVAEDTSGSDPELVVSPAGYKYYNTSTPPNPSGENGGDGLEVRVSDDGEYVSYLRGRFSSAPGTPDAQPLFSIFKTRPDFNEMQNIIVDKKFPECLGTSFAENISDFHHIDGNLYIFACIIQQLVGGLEVDNIIYYTINTSTNKVSSPKFITFDNDVSSGFLKDLRLSNTTAAEANVALSVTDNFNGTVKTLYLQAS